MQDISERRTVNRAFGKTIKIGSFEIYHFFVLLLYAVFFFYLGTAVSVSWIVLIVLWGLFSTLTLLIIGNKPWKLMRRLIKCPQVTRFGVDYQSILPSKGK